MSRPPRHQPAAGDPTPDTCADCGETWPCWSERVDRIVDRLPTADEIPPETRAKLIILLRPASAA